MRRKESKESRRDIITKTKMSGKMSVREREGGTKKESMKTKKRGKERKNHRFIQRTIIVKALNSQNFLPNSPFLVSWNINIILWGLTF